MRKVTLWKISGLLFVLGLFYMGTFLATGSSNVQANQQVVVQANNYQTLQAALDALPENGGIVELDAKTYEINQPLVLRTGDVLIRGKWFCFSYKK